MCANRICKMNTVAKAREWVDDMVEAETKREGVNALQAMRNLANRYRISAGDLYKIKYRQPKGLFVELYVKIADAYAAECLRQERKFRDGRERAEREIASIEALAFGVPDSRRPRVAVARDSVGAAVKSPDLAGSQDKPRGTDRAA
jgi:hypothetical protein